MLKGDCGSTVIWHFLLFPEGRDGTYGSSIRKKPQTLHWQAVGIGTGFRASITTDSKQMKEVCRRRAQRHLKNIQKKNLFTTGITTPWSPILKSKGGTTLILNMDFKYIIIIFTVYIKDCKHPRRGVRVEVREPSLWGLYWSLLSQPSTVTWTWGSKVASLSEFF